MKLRSFNTTCTDILRQYGLAHLPLRERGTTVKVWSLYSVSHSVYCDSNTVINIRCRSWAHTAGLGTGSSSIKLLSVAHTLFLLITSWYSCTSLGVEVIKKRSTSLPTHHLSTICLWRGLGVWWWISLESVRWFSLWKACIESESFPGPNQCGCLSLNCLTERHPEKQSLIIHEQCQTASIMGNICPLVVLYQRCISYSTLFNFKYLFYLVWIYLTELMLLMILKKFVVKYLNFV